MALEIEAFNKEGDNLVVLQLMGSLDTETYQQFTEKASHEAARAVKGMILDLGRLDYISSMGIGAILTVQKMFKDRQASFMMVNVPPHIDKVFQIVKALPDVKIFENMAEADRYFMEIQKQVKGRS